MILGLTGNLAAGKSSVSKWLRQQGWSVLDADQVVHEVYLRNPALVSAVASHFGPEVRGPAGLNRRKLAELVFGDQVRLQEFNGILRPWIKRELFERLKMLESRDARVLFDAPLLFEGGWDPYCTEVWCVFADDAMRLERAIHRGMSRVDAQNRIQAQMPQEVKLQRADFCIDNSGEPFAWVTEVEKRLKKIGF
jgi:dephospho-CoA kinase